VCACEGGGGRGGGRLVRGVKRKMVGRQGWVCEW
jgi:hypothetical protein